MRKRLLLAALAMVSVMGSYAYEIGEYAYTATQRLKITGENIVTNGNFAEGATGWYGANGAEAVNANVWQVTDAMGPNGEAVIESLGATADEPFCNTWALPGGVTYIVSFQVKAPAYANSTVGTTVGNNYADFFLNTTGSITHAASTDEAPVVDVATSFAMDTEWKDVAFVFTPEEGQTFVMHFEKFATGTQFTNIEIHAAQEVYDDRIVRRKVAFADKILADPNFNESEKAQAAREDFYNGVYAYVVAGLNGEDGGANFDDIADAESTLVQFEEGLNTYMDASAENMKESLPNIDITSIGAYGRGRFSSAGCFVLDGGNWGHLSGEDYLMSAIQKGYDHTATCNVVNTSFPAGKYFFTAEIRNANTDSKSWPCNLLFTLETTCKMFIGTDTIEIGPVAGEDYQQFYFVADLKEDGTFRAGVAWPGTGNKGGAFQIKNVSVRAFGNVKEEAERKAVWEKFIAQYNAVVNARKAVVEMQTDANYPWQKDSLARALTQWDPYYNDIMATGWVAEDGSDTRVATIEQLTDWTTYQGVELYDGEGKLLKFQLVRGYQYAYNYVKAQNKVFDDLKAEITKAESIRDDDMNQLGDKATFQTAIDAAQNTLTTTLATTTDETAPTDSVTVATAIVTLQEAEETFKKSVPELSPIVDIDFTNAKFEEVKETIPGEEGEEPTEVSKGYVIKGKVGEMMFTTNVNTTGDEGADGFVFDLGYKGELTDVLRIGNGDATVDIPEADQATENEVLRVNFDFWFGRLTKCFVKVDLLNAAGERVAGFRFQPYDGTLDYNDFNNADNTGMSLETKYYNAVTTGNVGNYGDNNRTSFDLIIDNKAMTVQGNIDSSTKGLHNGELVGVNSVTDRKIARFVVGSNYNYADARRCWFDNLKIVKYASTATGPNEQVGITSVNANTQATGAIYTLSGMQVKGAPAKGLYIKDGKKFVIK